MYLITEYTNPKYYDLSVSDIWYFEKLYYQNIEKNIELALRVTYEVRSIVIKKMDPAFTVKLYDEGDDDAKKYYARKVTEFQEIISYPERIFDLDYFFHNGNCYEYATNDTIDRNEVNESLFQFFFALKLRQYKYALIHSFKFLDHQLRSNFKRDKESYIEFLILLIRQYSDLFSEELIKTINDYLNKLRKKSPADLVGLKSFLLVGYRDYGNEYFIKNANEISEAFIELKDNKFIHPDTRLREFRRIFTQSTIQQDKRIIWIGRHVELKWFIQIFIDDLEKIVPPVVGRWKIASYCFADKDGMEFEKEETIGKASGKTDERKDTLRNILEKL